MKKKKSAPKKLTLSRETVTQLDDVLQSVAGGCATTGGSNGLSCYFSACFTGCIIP